MKIKTQDLEPHYNTAVEHLHRIPNTNTPHRLWIRGSNSLKRTALAFIVLFVCLALSFNTSSQSITNGLIAYWSFNGGPQDDSGKGHDGVVSGATPTSDAFGMADGAYSFDGVNDYIDIGNGVKPNFPFSFVARFKGTGSFGDGALFSNDSINSGNNRYGFAVDVHSTNATIIFFSGFASVNTRYSRRTPKLDPLNDGAWHSIVVVCRSLTEVDFFVDGQRYASLYEAGNGGNHTYSTSGTGKIGARRPDLNNFAGSIDEVLVYNRALSSNEVLQVIAGEWMITRQPQNQQIPIGAHAVFTVEIAGPTNPSPRYQWFFNNNPIPGATNKALLIENVRFSDTGDYHVEISFPWAVLNSRIARLSVLPFAIAVFPAIEIEFPSEAGKTYSIQYSTDLISWSDQEGETNIPGTGQLIRRFLTTRETHAKYFKVLAN